MVQIRSSCAMKSSPSTFSPFPLTFFLTPLSLPELPSMRADDVTMSTDDSMIFCQSWMHLEPGFFFPLFFSLFSPFSFPGLACTRLSRPFVSDSLLGSVLLIIPRRFLVSPGLHFAGLFPAPCCLYMILSYPVLDRITQKVKNNVLHISF